MKYSATDLDAFTSPNYPPLAEMGIGVKFYLPYTPIYSNKNFSVADSLCRNVAILRVFPSITVETVKAFFEPPVEGLSVHLF